MQVAAAQHLNRPWSGHSAVVKALPEEAVQVRCRLLQCSTSSGHSQAIWQIWIHC